MMVEFDNGNVLSPLLTAAPLLKKYGTLLIKSLERDPELKSSISRMVIEKLHPLLI